jgi:hypothetical protein
VNEIVSVRELMESLQREFDEAVASISESMHTVLHSVEN